MATIPGTLLEAIRYFSDIETSTHFLAQLRWPDGPVCPRCEGREYGYLKTRRLWKCRSCKKQYSVKLGTIFEDSPIGLDKWLPAVWLIANCKNGISSHELARALGVHQQTAWFMLHRIRLAMKSGSFEVKYSDKFEGAVEVDETYIGGKARNMHASKRKQLTKGHFGKTAVMGFLERGGEVRLTVIPHARKPLIQQAIRRRVKPGAAIYTDSLGSYSGLDAQYAHEVIDHAETYVQGRVHTNGLENFWSLLKRGLGGTYISVQPFHLHRYLDEQVFRFNGRDGDDASRFVSVLSRVAGRRLTYAELTGRTETGEEPPPPGPTGLKPRSFPMGPWYYPPSEG